MKLIPLTQGKFAKVDYQDFEYLNRWKWCATRSLGTFYAVRVVTGVDGKKTSVYMHRAILKPQNGLQVDHINGDGLNNTRENLRACSRSENMMNRGKVRNNSGFKGVFWHKPSETWQVAIRSDGDLFPLGYFKDPIEAAKRYDIAAKLLHGKFARLNFPNPIP